ncbi:MAG: phosphoribosylformimino-5-aminoimidazole carboxamide ribotide isomerase [Victivallales bacterium]|nr:phosphoribosylformimino-5-aminoimidazole carboxamide ribotide isomerase [Victivallales bacterium]
MDFRPCIDLHDGKVKQIVGSSLSDSGQGLTTNFEAEHDAAYYARMYREDGLTGGHVIMLGPGNAAAAQAALAAYPGGLQLGGGITADNAGAWLDAGAAGVILTSYIFCDGVLRQDRLDRIFAAVGRERLVLDLSCRRRDDRYFIVTDRWQKFTTLEVNAATLSALSAYCGEFLIHAVDVEGKQSGIDRELLALMAGGSPLPCVYAGGISSWTEIELIKNIGRGRIGYTVGSALDIFGGRVLKYRDIVAREKQGR